MSPSRWLPGGLGSWWCHGCHPTAHHSGRLHLPSSQPHGESRCEQWRTERWDTGLAEVWGGRAPVLVTGSPRTLPPGQTACCPTGREALRGGRVRGSLNSLEGQGFVRARSLRAGPALASALPLPGGSLLRGEAVGPSLSLGRSEDLRELSTESLL